MHQYRIQTDWKKLQNEIPLQEEKKEEGTAIWSAEVLNSAQDGHTSTGCCILSQLLLESPLSIQSRGVVGGMKIERAQIESCAFEPHGFHLLSQVAPSIPRSGKMEVIMSTSKSYRK